MKELSDDHMDKDLNKRVEIKLTRNIPDLISPWDLSNYINAIASFYYKIELINSLTTVINNEIPPANIFILDGSFKLNKSNRELRRIYLNDNGVKILFNIGNPVSLFPNEDLFALNLIFKLYKNINKFLSEIRYRRLHKVRLKHSFDIFRKNGFTHSIMSIIEVAEKILIEKAKISESDIEGEKKLTAYKFTLSRLKKQTVSDFEEFLKIKNNSILDYITECLQKNNEIILDKKLQKNGFKINEILDKYYSEFFKKLNKLSRPIVGIYYGEREHIEILSLNNIISSPRSVAFLDIKQISHRSPLEIIILGLPSLALLFKGTIQVLDIIIKKQEIKLNKLRRKNLELQIKEKELKIKKHEGEKNKELLLETKDLYEKNIGNVSSKYLRDGLSRSYVMLLDNGEKFTKKNKLNVHDASQATS